MRKLREESENEADTDASNARRDAARKRAARERQQRVEQALEELVKLKEQKEKRKKGSGKAARCSTTDPQARNMKMPGGGYRPADNVQFASAGKARVIISVDVTNSGSDRGQMSSMHEDVSRRYAKTPRNYAVDCGFATKEDITRVEKRGSRVIAPIHGADSMRERGTDPPPRPAAIRQRGDVRIPPADGDRRGEGTLQTAFCDRRISQRRMSQPGFASVPGPGAGESQNGLSVVRDDIQFHADARFERPFMKRQA